MFLDDVTSIKNRLGLHSHEADSAYYVVAGRLALRDGDDFGGTGLIVGTQD